MSQGLIQYKFFRFLEIRIAKLKREKKQDREYIKTLENVLKAMGKTFATRYYIPCGFFRINLPVFPAAEEGGFCAGFSISYGVMRYLKKLDWWHAACSAISQWDENETTLEEIVELPGATSSNVKLETIFERVYDYITLIYASTPSLSPFNIQIFSGFKKFLFPKEQGGGLELVVPESKGEVKGAKPAEQIRSVIENYRIAGHFSVESLQKILGNESTQDYIRNNICQVSSIRKKHQCDVWIDEVGRWWFYDPNYSEETVDDVHHNNDEARMFPTIEALSTEIHRVLGDDLTFELAQLSPTEEIEKPFAEYDRMLQVNPGEFSQGWGLWEIAECTPEIIPKVLRYDPHLPNEEVEEKKFQPLKDINLNLKDHHGWTVLHQVAREGREKAIMALIAKGAHSHELTKENYTPFGFAIAFKQVPPMIRAILNLERMKSGYLDNELIDRTIENFINKELRASIKLLALNAAKSAGSASLMLAGALGISFGVFFAINPHDTAKAINEMTQTIADEPFISATIFIIVSIFAMLSLMAKERYQMKQKYVQLIEHTGVLKEYRSEEEYSSEQENLFHSLEDDIERSLYYPLH